MSLTNTPNVIVIGASKCGTTSLYEYFSRHPDIFVPEKKELHYHSSAELIKYTGGPGDKYIIQNICLNQQKYLDYYTEASSFLLKADVSPSYLFFPSCINSIKETCGSDVKIICMIKNPVDKMISQYTHLLSAGRETLSFKEALTKETERKSKLYADMWLYKESGYMNEKILEFKKIFKHTIVINSEDLIKNTKDTLQIIFDFLNVDKDKLTDHSPLSKNFSGTPRSLLVSKLFIQPNFFTQTIRRIIPQRLGKTVREWINNKNKGKKYDTDINLQKLLEAGFYDEIIKLNDIIDSPTKIQFKYHK